MSSSPNRSDFAVGLTVLGVLAAVVAAVLWVKQSGVGSRGDERVARTRSVGGIAVGNPVVIRGVRAGQIRSIALADNGWVSLTFSVSRDVDVPREPVVLLAASTLFGEWQATLTDLAGVPPDRELRAALNEARTRGDTLPAAVLPDIAQLTSVAGRIAGDVAKVSERVETAFDDAAAKELRTFIANVAKLSADLSRTVNAQSRNLDRISTDVSRGLATINQASGDLRTVAGRLETATSRGEITRLVSSADSAVRVLLDAAQLLRTTAASLTSTERGLQRTVTRTDSILARVDRGDGTLGLLVNDPRLYRASDSLVSELRALVADVRKNPRRYFNLRVF
jgi:phospholipid/cholesterol/gamma-HCH transport system substrate-binding protein